MQISIGVWLYSLLMEGGGETKQLHLTKNRVSVTRTLWIQGSLDSRWGRKRVEVKSGVSGVSCLAIGGSRLRCDSRKLMCLNMLWVFTLNEVLPVWIKLDQYETIWENTKFTCVILWSSCSCTRPNLITSVVWQRVLGSLHSALRITM